MKGYKGIVKKNFYIRHRLQGLVERESADYNARLSVVICTLKGQCQTNAFYCNMSSSKKILV